MKQQTRQYLEAAERHRDFALALAQRRLAPAPLEWAAIAAFYSAVHYINAYLWETYNFAPENHADRTLAVRRDATLASIALFYDQLRAWGFSGRYRPTFRPSDDLLQRALAYLEQIRSTILSALNP